jgi:hypothetical protein
MLGLTMFASDFLRWLTDNSRSARWEDTAMSWLVAALVIAIVCAAGTMGFKAVKKSTAKNVEQKIWSRGQTLMLIIGGLAPVLAMMAIIWYMTRDFFNIMGVGGLFKGIVLGWLLYLVIMLCAHLLSPWRRELI